MSHLRIGTSGWHYPDGKGTWNGIFYPPVGRRPRGFDELSFYAEHFDTVEVNSTFYGQPRASVSQKWADRTPEGFEFSVKLYQKFTHPKMFKKRIEQAVPEGDQAAIEELARPNLADLDEFKRGIDPLATSGKLGALLAQFPPSFKFGPSEIDYLTRSPPGLLRVLARRRAQAQQLERPDGRQRRSVEQLRGGVGPDRRAQVSTLGPSELPAECAGIYYMRLHGRNASAWWTHEQAEDRYNYLYTAEELVEITETAGAARELVKKAYLYTNNHYSAKSVANAAMIKQQLGEPVDGEYDPEFAARYPELAPALRIGRLAGRGRVRDADRLV